VDRVAAMEVVVLAWAWARCVVREGERRVFLFNTSLRVGDEANLNPEAHGPRDEAMNGGCTARLTQGRFSGCRLSLFCFSEIYCCWMLMLLSRGE